MKSALEYRPEIDGLRAIAALGVLLYHLDVPPFSGGFVGVDIFFVISGYLISGIILSEAASGRFSFGDFYARRARRLLPALIATIVLSFIAAAILFAPEDLRRTGVSTATALVGLSNISFWLESDYFDAAAILKPLLHTWSLAVELQFYLVWPAFLLLLSRFGRACVIAGIIATIAVGTVASIWVLTWDQSAAFYLTPFRMNEFAVGALVACLAAPISRRLADALFLSGLAAIAASLVMFSDLTVFPGYAVLVPVAGTALVLFAGGAAGAASFLRSWPAVHIGRISYSLYLVHWPLIVFVQYMRDRPLTPLVRWELIAATFALAELSYWLIEKPLRRPRLTAISPHAAFCAGCAAVIAATMAPALHAGFGNGWVWRFPADLQALNSIDVEEQRRHVWENFNRLQVPRFSTARPHVLVVGDSQAADLVNMLIAAGFDRKAEIVTRAVIWECGMPFLPEEQREAFWKEVNSRTIKEPSLIETCEHQYQELASPDVLGAAQYVIIAYYWQDNALRRIDAALSDLGDRTGARILLVGAKAFDRSSAQMVNTHGRIEGVEAFAADHISPLSRRVNAFIGGNFPDRFVNLLSAICPRADFCRVLTDEQKPIFFDFDHLTRAGADYLGRNAVAQLFPFLGRQ
jgi:peptidoglycan/LPS O-acetylase OafA/YrhL